MKLTHLALGIIMFFTTGCNWDTTSNKYELVKGTDYYTLGLKQSIPGYFYPSIAVFNQDDTSFIYYFCKADTTLRILSTKNMEDVKFISLSSIFNERIDYSNKESAFSYLENQDLLWLDSPTSDSIYQVDLSSLNVVKSISKKLNNKDIFLSDFIQQHINSTKNELILGIYDDTKGAFGLFEIQNNTFLLKEELDTHPDDYKNKDMYLYSGVLTDISPDSFIVSYYYSDTVALFVKNKFVKQICLKSDSSVLFSGFEGDRNDMNAIKKFFAMKQRYDHLLYDNKNKFYYRVFSFELESKSIGKIEYSKKWSICIFDASFKKIHEEFFNEDDYYKGYVLLIDSDLYLANSKKSLFMSWRDSSTVVFDKFTLQSIKN